MRNHRSNPFGIARTPSSFSSDSFYTIAISLPTPADGLDDAAEELGIWVDDDFVFLRS